MPMILVSNAAAGYRARTYGLSPASSVVGLIKETSEKNRRAEAAQSGGV